MQRIPIAVLGASGYSGVEATRILAQPALLRESIYGIPELGSRDAIAKARLIANPGCYPTASALALAPLLREGLLAAEGVVVDAASGTTGAGRKATEEMSFSEVMD